MTALWPITIFHDDPAVPVPGILPDVIVIISLPGPIFPASVATEILTAGLMELNLAAHELTRGSKSGELITVRVSTADISTAPVPGQTVPGPQKERELQDKSNSPIAECNLNFIG